MTCVSHTALRKVHFDDCDAVIGTSVVDLTQSTPLRDLEGRQVSNSSGSAVKRVELWLVPREATCDVNLTTVDAERFVVICMYM